MTLNGSIASSTNYGAGATPTTIAQGLESGTKTSSFVNISANGDDLYLESKLTGAGTNYSYAIATTSYDSTNFTHPSFAYPAITGTLGGGANAGTSTGQQIYSYTATYDGVGNVASYNDSVMGNWDLTGGYDTLNRLMAMHATSGVYNGQYYCWTYDAFGNRTAQVSQTSACSSGTISPTVNYNAKNQVTWVQNTAPSGFTYDAAGNVTADNANTYLYDAEGRICAVRSESIAGTYTLTGYLYDADGTRVAKGSIAAWSCDPTANGFQTQNDYILGPGGEQMTEMTMDTDASMYVAHNNVWAGGKLQATYDAGGDLHFYLTDPLGSRRVQTNYAGFVEQNCRNLPYGDGENCGSTPTEHLFTGKERDSESGNDYFGARYYASSMGRWMSPDKPFADQHTRNPQSWNLYTYSLNNPLRYVDTDGRKVEETRTVTYYPVTGATASQALANANAHSFGSSGDHAGLTTPTMTWHTDTSYSYQTTNGNVTVTTTVTSDTITLNQNVQLPQWDGYSKASPDEQKTWDDAVSKLQGHETDHEDINRAGADALDKSLPGTTSTASGKDLDPTVKASQNNNDAAVQNKVDASNQATDQKNKQLDTCTNHGTQGCSK